MPLAYPRPSGRGPIEAPSLAAKMMRPVASYPRPSGRGPIEAWRRYAGRPTTKGYPRPSGRGPIEAPLSALLVSLASPAPIRDRQVAAPLKPRTRRRLPSHTRCYPRPSGRGPIEAETTLEDAELERDASIRDRQVAAPLKRSLFPAGLRCDVCSIRDRQVAAPLKRRVVPHDDERDLPYPRPSGRGPIEAKRTLA